MTDVLASLPFEQLLSRVRACTLCAENLPYGPRPVIQMAESAKILVVGQAPGRRVHATGLPFNDPSGDRLRQWMGVDREAFYDERQLAILPMGFCYPGTGKNGDLPPRPECAPAWRNVLLQRLPNVAMTLLIGQYAQNWHLVNPARTVTVNVQGWKSLWPAVLPMPHPSPRNNLWLRRNPWFETEVVPALQKRVADLLKVR